MSKQHQDAGPPEPGRAVAASTTQTDQPQAGARNIRKTDWLAPGEGPENPGPPAPEQEWFAHRDESRPAHERVVGEARAVGEALARLGPGASAEDVRRDLQRLGLRFSLDDINRARASLGAAGGAAAPADLVRTEGEGVPPPRGGAGS